MEAADGKAVGGDEASSVRVGCKRKEPPCDAPRGSDSGADGGGTRGRKKRKRRQQCERVHKWGVYKHPAVEELRQLVKSTPRKIRADIAMHDGNTGIAVLVCEVACGVDVTSVVRDTSHFLNVEELCEMIALIHHPEEGLAPYRCKDMNAWTSDPLRIHPTLVSLAYHKDSRHLLRLGTVLEQVFLHYNYLEKKRGRDVRTHRCLRASCAEVRAFVSRLKGGRPMYNRADVYLDWVEAPKGSLVLYNAPYTTAISNVMTFSHQVEYLPYVSSLKMEKLLRRVYDARRSHVYTVVRGDMRSHSQVEEEFRDFCGSVERLPLGDTVMQSVLGKMRMTDRLYEHITQEWSSRKDEERVLTQLQQRGYAVVTPACGMRNHEMERMRWMQLVERAIDEFEMFFNYAATDKCNREEKPHYPLRNRGHEHWQKLEQPLRVQHMMNKTGEIPATQALLSKQSGSGRGTRLYQEEAQLSLSCHPWVVHYMQLVHGTKYVLNCCGSWRIKLGGENSEYVDLYPSVYFRAPVRMVSSAANAVPPGALLSNNDPKHAPPGGGDDVALS